MHVAIKSADSRPLFQIEEGKDFQDIVNYIEDYYREKCRNLPKMYSPSHIFDEEKSVKWNREHAAELNAQRQEQRDELLFVRKEMYEQMQAAVIEYCAEFLNITAMPKVAADALIGYLKNHNDYEWPKYLDDALELIDIFEKSME